LIDKVRLHAKEQLPQAYVANVLVAELTLDGRFLSFTELDTKALHHVILSRHTDAEVLAWIQAHARPTTTSEQQAWAEQIDRYRPDAALVEHRKNLYPEFPARVDIGSLSVLDMIDMDEGRLPIKD
jgi:hypothetical protein